MIYRVLNMARVALTAPRQRYNQAGREDSDGPVRFADNTASVPPSGTEQVSAGRQDRLVARQLGKCFVPRFALPSGGDHYCLCAALP
jgi:hypothetical protein